MNTKLFVAELDALRAGVNALKRRQAENATELDAFPAIDASAAEDISVHY